MSNAMKEWECVMYKRGDYIVSDFLQWFVVGQKIKRRTERNTNHIIKQQKIVITISHKVFQVLYKVNYSANHLMLITTPW